MITGPPGIGKTTSAHMCAQLAGLTPIEVNASDSRSKKLVEVRISTANSDQFITDIGATHNLEWSEHGQYIVRRVDGQRESESWTHLLGLTR